MKKRGWHPRRYVIGVCTALLFTTAGLLNLSAQFQFPTRYASGQDVSPVFQGWEANPDGTISLWFGYFNRNSQEEIDVPVGPANTFDLGNGDQGQPTHFYPGTRWWVFKVVVPKDWPKDKRAVWTLTNRGRTNLAKGWLEPEWEVDYLAMSANSGSDPFLSNVTRSIADNVAPMITGGPAQTITLPAPATLAVTVTDDRVPEPKGRGDRNGNVQGVRVRWILYRGEGKVQIDPAASPYVYGKPLTSQTKVSFSRPGNYRIRAIASDGALFSTYDFDVTVNPSKSAASGG